MPTDPIHVHPGYSGHLALSDYRLLFESAPGLFLVLLPDFTIIGASTLYLQATMTTLEEIVGRGVFDVFPDNPDDHDATGVRNLSASLHRVVHERAPDAMAVQKYDVTRPESQGGGFERRYWSPSNWPVFGPDGAVAYIIHRVEDVTEFIRLRGLDGEQETRATEPDSHDGQIEVEIFQRAQQVQEANRGLRHAKEKLEERVRERTSQLAEANDALRAEIRQNKRLEEQFRQAQKMEAIGTLAGGIAHDFNNLLTVIVGYTETLRALNFPESAHEMIEEISKAGQRAATLTRQLLAFSRQQVLEPRVVDLNAIVTEIDKMLRRLIGEDIVLTLKLQSNLGYVRIDPGQMEQIIMNLAVNARDAMPHGGRLDIETTDIELDEPYAQEHLDVLPGRYVMLAISDTGIGMDETTRARIFEPFFTTKSQHKGTGLGLATVFGILKQSGGHIWVYSEPDRGTTFKIYLPFTEHGVPATTTPTTTETSGTETILVVEDDDAVRAITVLILRKQGYDVLEADNGARALAICEEHRGPIHLLISDVVMPEMGGRLVAEAVESLHPEARVLFLSGYTDDTVVRYGVLHEHVAFLQKPFTPGSLARKVRSVLTGSSSVVE